MTRPPVLAALLMLAATGPALAQETRESPLLAAGSVSGLPLVEPNDNARPAGSLRDGTRTIALEVTRADWRVEGPGGPGLQVAAIGEAGGAPTVPAPLIRVEAWTRLAVTVRNQLATASVTVFGLQPHPVAEADSFVVAPGAAGIVEFEAGAPGTYLYWMREGPPTDEAADSYAEREQLAGAFVVDAPGEQPDDRVLGARPLSRPRRAGLPALPARRRHRPQPAVRADGRSLARPRARRVVRRGPGLERLGRQVLADHPARELPPKSGAEVDAEVVTRDDGAIVPITLHAKDGADLPAHQRMAVETLPRLFVGETADFTWTPEEPGMYELHVGVAPAPEAHLVQRWVVAE